eukprot:scaffold233092_cov37-Tisochrysis_lutea.AAC.2
MKWADTLMQKCRRSITQALKADATRELGHVLPMSIHSVARQLPISKSSRTHKAFQLPLPHWPTLSPNPRASHEDARQKLNAAKFRPVEPSAALANLSRLSVSHAMSVSRCAIGVPSCAHKLNLRIGRPGATRGARARRNRTTPKV